LKIDDIFKEWEKDREVNRGELGYAALDIPKLHAKYYRILIDERLRLRKQEAELKTLMLDKREFYSGNNTERHHAMGWELPDRGAIIKNELPHYLGADQDIIKANLKIALQQEKVKALEAIVDVIVKRGFHINSAIAWEKFKAGA